MAGVIDQIRGCRICELFGRNGYLEYNNRLVMLNFCPKIIIFVAFFQFIQVINCRKLSAVSMANIFLSVFELYRDLILFLQIVSRVSQAPCGISFIASSD